MSQRSGKRTLDLVKRDAEIITVHRKRRKSPVRKLASKLLRKHFGHDGDELFALGLFQRSIGLILWEYAAEQVCIHGGFDLLAGE